MNPENTLKKHVIVCCLLVACLIVIGSGCSSSGGNNDNATPSGGNPPAQPGTATVLAFNDLGMHCMDEEFSVFSILPPFNILNTQVVLRDSRGNPRLVDDTDVLVSYDAVADAGGSINSYSYSTESEKTNFWVHANALFGTTLQPGEGLTGFFMPQDHPADSGPQSMVFNAAHNWFSGEGIPITPLDDDLNMNPYPLMRVTATDDTSGAEAGAVDAVVPVAIETDCANCHATNEIAADEPTVTWSTADNVEIQSKENILLLHDDLEGTNLIADQPVLCAECHYSKALDLSGAGPAGAQAGNPTFSNVMHGYHGSLTEGGLPVFPPTGAIEQNCYQCHPGRETQCQRGAMKTGGMDCFDCHGNMTAVGNAGREPWTDLPKCQSCHTGDAVSHLSGSGLVADASGIRLTQAFVTGDATSTPIAAVNPRFAENTGELFRNSFGHSGIACEACHGSTHAIWPNADPDANDNVTAKQLQGHSGTVIECSACHGSGLALTVNGPHGLHNINDNRWVDENHGDFFENNEAHCRACHGVNLTGTVLSETAVARSFQTEEGSETFVAGEQVRCDKCHEMP